MQQLTEPNVLVFEWWPNYFRVTGIRICYLLYFDDDTIYIPWLDPDRH